MTQILAVHFTLNWMEKSSPPTSTSRACTISLSKGRGGDCGPSSETTQLPFTTMEKNSLDSTRIYPITRTSCYLPGGSVSLNIYDLNIRELARWLWPKLLQKELDAFMDFRNGVRMRKDKKKPGPSGMSRREAFTFPEKWGGQNLLLPIPVEAVRELKEQLGGEALIQFVSEEYAA